MTISLQERFKYCAPREWTRTKRLHKQHRRWVDLGSTGQPPHTYKQAVLREYAQQHALRTLIETGTFRGDMCFALRNDFDSIITIELSERFHEIASFRLRRFAHIELLLGDSAQVLPRVLERLTSPALFWLDGHYSGGITAQAALDTPILAELRPLLEHPIKGHVVLIDDARLFDGTNDYPKLDDLQRWVHELNLDMSFEMRDDIIRIVQRGGDA
jgi:hypothetical protein